MIEIVQVIGICVALILCMWAVYQAGILEGRHRERTNLLNILSTIKDEDMTATTRYHILYVVSGIVKRMREE